MKNRIFYLIIAVSFVFSVSAQVGSFHNFKAKSIDGELFDMASLKGKKVLVVNTASKCGLTPQYEALEKVYEKYRDQNFVIIGFPANNFLGQEPGTNSEIAEFCKKNYGVSFPMMEKISVKGDDKHPIYKWLTEKSENGKFDASVSWNFQKFMIDENGQLVDFASPREKPDSEKIINWIEGKL
jgi:glutathione peroxidase